MIEARDVNEMLDELWPGAHAECLELGKERALARIVVQPHQIRPGGFVSGPTQFAVADLACWLLVSGALGEVTPMALTSELSIRFLRPAVGEELFAEATLERLGRTSLVATIRVWCADRARPCAVAQATYALPKKSVDA